MIGKMIFFGTYAISKAMFPISVQRFEEKEHSGDLLKNSSLLVSIICLFAILIIGLFPKLIIQILFGSQYLGVSNYLVYLAIGFSFLCMSNLFLIYGLSKNKIKLTESFVMIFFILSEIVLLSIFNKTLIQFITIFIILNVAMFLWSLIIVRK
jgi:O-antigen/teichoic acid export membrane protein